MNNKDHTHESANRVYDRKGCCPTVNTCGGGGLEPKVIRKWTKKDMKVIGGVSESVWGKQFKQQDRVYDTKMCCAAINAAGINGLYIKKYGSRDKTSG